jgi:hypothetical protein
VIKGAPPAPARLHSCFTLAASTAVKHMFCGSQIRSRSKPHSRPSPGGMHLLLVTAARPHQLLQRQSRTNFAASDSYLAVCVCSWVEQVAAPSQPHLQAHHQALTQRVDGGVGHLAGQASHATTKDMEASVASECSRSMTAHRPAQLTAHSAHCINTRPSRSGSMGGGGHLQMNRTKHGPATQQQRDMEASVAS